MEIQLLNYVFYNVQLIITALNTVECVFNSVLLEFMLIIKPKNVNAPVQKDYTKMLQPIFVYQVALTELLLIYQQRVVLKAVLMDMWETS